MAQTRHFQLQLPCVPVRTLDGQFSVDVKTARSCSWPHGCWRAFGPPVANVSICLYSGQQMVLSHWTYRLHGSNLCVQIDGEGNFFGGSVSSHAQRSSITFQKFVTTQDSSQTSSQSKTPTD